MFNNKIFRYIDSLSEHAELQETKKRYKPTAIMKEWGKHKNESVAQFSKYSILLFQIGSFFECYFEDAFVLSKVLNIALTKKNKNIPFSPFMSGFWVDSLLDKVNTLVEAGLHVVVVRQGMKGNQVVRRRAEIFTPWDEKNNTFYSGIWFDGGESVWYLSFFNKDTLNYKVYKIKTWDDGLFSSLYALYRCNMQILHAEDFVAKAKHKELIKKFPLMSFYITTGNISKDPIEEYCQYVFSDPEIASKFRRYEVFVLDEGVKTLDSNTIQNLEIFGTKEGTEHSLFQFINKTLTKMGERKLREGVISIDKDKKYIDRIHTSLREMQQIHLQDSKILSQVRRFLASFPDIDVLVGKILLSRIMPLDIYNIYQLAGNFLSLVPLLEKYKFLHTDAQHIEDVRSLYFKFSNILAEDFSHTATSGNIFRRWYDQLLDSYIEAVENNEGILYEYKLKVIEQTGLSFSVNKQNGGFFLEIHNKKIPKNWNKPENWESIRGTTIYDRFAVPELTEIYNKYYLANTQRNKREYELLKELRVELFVLKQTIVRISEIIFRIDLLQSYFSFLEKGWVLPLVTEDKALTIEDGRHPMLEALCEEGEYVVNSVDFKNSSFKCLTGMNMWGKTIFMKMIGIITLLSQIGHPVPAKSATIWMVDNIFVRAGASDNFIKQQSTFVLEMSELSHILNSYSDRSLVLIDEIGRGTDYQDGFSIALATAEWLKSQGARTVFTTHFHEIAKFFNLYKWENLYVEYIKDNLGELVFTHKILEGIPSNEESLGILVARKTGVNEEILTRALEIKNRFNVV